MLIHLMTAALQASSSGIPTAADAELGVPIWVLATWGLCLAFALWVISVVVREWNHETLEEGRAEPATLEKVGERAEEPEQSIAS